MEREKVLVDAMREHVRSLGRAHRVAYLAKLLWGSKYGWGEEWIGSSDCSGTVFFGLWLMGYRVRLTAHDLLTRMCDPVNERNAEVGDLAFWWREDGSRVQHVAIIGENGYVLNAAGTRVHEIGLEGEKRKRYLQRFEVGRLNWEKVKGIAERGREAYGVDEPLVPLLGLFEV